MTCAASGCSPPLALAASLVNLMTTEYFFLLDLVRPLLIWVVLSSGREQRARPNGGGR